MQPGSSRVCTSKMRMRRLHSSSVPGFTFMWTIRTIIRLAFQLRDEFINPDSLFTIGSGGNHRDLCSGFLLEELQILLRFRRKFFVIGDAFGAGLPSVELTINRF